MNTIIIQTALVIEWHAVIRRLHNVKDYTHPVTKTIYKAGDYICNDNKLRIVVGRTNQTNINAAIETERIINHFNPSYIFFVGVAGGLKDVTIGDIVIGSDVCGYERGKADDEFKPRLQFGFSSYELEQFATSFSISDQWTSISRSFIDLKFKTKPSVYAGTIASGEKVVGSTKSELYSFLKRNCSHALAVEMEGLGFLEACRHYPLIKTLLIRGISDLIDGKEKSDQKGSQPYASKIATDFLFGLIDYIKIEQTPTNVSLKDKLFEISVKLYPEGIKDSGIWVRAGGNLSIIRPYSAGKAQWFEALTVIENGGGGDIDFDSLIKEMRKDYPRNVSLSEI